MTRLRIVPQTRVWDLSHLNRRPKTIEVPWIGLGETMALSPDGRRVYLSAPVAAYSVRTGQRLWKADVASTWLPLDLSPDGRHLAVVPNDTGLNIALISTRRGRVERILRGASGIVVDVTFSDDGSQVAAVSQAQELLTWNRNDSHPTQTITIDGSGGVQLNPDASRAYVSDAGEGTVVTWDLAGDSSYLKLVATHPKLSTVRSASSGRRRTARASPSISDDLDAVQRDDGSRLTVARTPATGRSTPGLLATRRTALRDRHRARPGPDLRRRRASCATTRVSRASLTDVDYAADGATFAVNDVTGRVALLDAPTTLELTGTPVHLPGPTSRA